MSDVVVAEQPLEEGLKDEGVKIVIDQDGRLVVTASHMRFAQCDNEGGQVQAWQRTELNVGVTGKVEPVELTLENISSDFPFSTIVHFANMVSDSVEAVLDDWQIEVESGITPIPEYTGGEEESPDPDEEIEID